MLCPYSLSAPGGVQGQVTGLAAALRHDGHDVVVLAPADEGTDLGPDGPDLVRLGRAIAVPANGSVAPVALSPGAVRTALDAVRGGGFEVLHLHEPLVPGPGLACLVRCSLPMVGTFHRAGAGPGYRALGRVARGAAQRLAARCAVSEEAAATAASVLGDGAPYEIVGNGIDTRRLLAATPWPTEGPTVLFVGRHEPRKGLSVLLAAAAALGPDGPTLWVAGEGPDTERLRRRHPAGPRLAWLGRVGDDALAARLAGAHALCAPSVGGESFGVVLLEAMAARTAVVASDIPGYAAVVDGHGVLVPAGDVGAWATALASVTADAAAATGRCAPAALDAAAAHAARWSMPRVAARYVEVYRRVARSPGP
ncbi:MAG TPA: glycosyltransferase family 4 protein [Acidimicrobiales bacterium]|nr:glycosyltransferase family 4 protein [Acidimicrobiales bacterium]